ncbi:MAG: hypothetical protein ACRD8O_18410 [Bryobacteraceae bacterium]
MFIHRKLPAAVCLLAGLARTAAAQTRVCDWRAVDMLDAHVVLDANTGQILDGGTRLAARDQVQVIVANQNPFKYRYRIDLRTQSKEEAVIGSFLHLISAGFGSLITSLIGPAAQPRDLDTCPEARKVNALIAEDRALVDQLNARVRTPDLYNRFLAATDGDSIECSRVAELDVAARDLLPMLSVSDLASRVRAFRKDVDSLIAPCIDALILQNLKQDAAVFAARMEELEAAYQARQASFGQLAALLKRYLAPGTPFLEIRYPQTAGGASIVTIGLFRSNLRSPDPREELIQNVELHTGESRLALTAGLGFSSVPDRQIARQISLGDSGGVLANRFAYTSNSTFKPSGVVALSGRVWGRGSAGLALSAGLVVGARGGGEPEFVAGPSISLLHNLMLVTAGFHAARVPALAGGFQIGDKVPAGLQDPLPLVRSFHRGLMIALTFRIR